MKKIRFAILSICLFFTVYTQASVHIIKDVHNDSIKGIAVPEAMDRNLDQLLQQWLIDNTTQTCTLNSTDPIYYSDSVYINRLYNLPTHFELVYNSAVKNFIELYAGRRKGQVSYMLGLSQFYFPLFEEVLIREGLPTELKYLPIIESALNTTVKSRAGAAGLWQFMPATGKLYGLEVNSRVDERLDPIKATNAAVKYLKDMYAIYGDWSLVIAAYNCGPGNVNKAIARSNGSRDYWEIYPFLPKETRGYVPAFIGATYIMNFYDKHNICPAEMTMPLLVDTISINKILHFRQIAEVLNVPIEQIRLLNPQYRDDIVPGGHKSYSIRLPLNNLTAFIAEGDKIYQYKADELFTHRKIKEIENAESKIHKVRKGETLGLIAAKYGVSTSKLRSLNRLKSDRLSIGQRIVVSVRKPITLASSSKNKANGPNIQEETNSELVVIDGVLKRKIENTIKSTSYYTVVKGDTWNGLTKKTGASMANIKKWNNIKNNTIIAGKKIKIIGDTTVVEYEDIQKPGSIKLKMDEVKGLMSTYIDSIQSPLSSFKMPFLNAFNNNDISTTIVAEEYELEQDEEDGSIILEHQLIYGETLSKVAEMYNVSLNDLKKWNHINSDTESTDLSYIIIRKTAQQIAQDYTLKKNI